MPNVTITNVQTVDDFLPSLYKKFAAGEAITVFRQQSELDGMDDLKDRVAAGQFTATTVYTAQELLAAVGKLACAPGSAVVPGQQVQRGQTAPLSVAAPIPPTPVAFPAAYKAATIPDIAISVDRTLAPTAQFTVEIISQTNAGFSIVVTLTVPGAPGEVITVDWVAVGEAA
jgi:hypothetical protein